MKILILSKIKLSFAARSTVETHLICQWKKIIKGHLVKLEKTKKEHQLFVVKASQINSKFSINFLD